MAERRIFLFDFDSTFIQVETLEVLADIALANHPQRSSRLETIQQITNEAMQGRYSYQESLRERYALLDLNANHINLAIEAIKHKITPSFLRNIGFFKKNADSIHVITGAFGDIVWPIVKAFGLKRDNVHANRLIYDFEGELLGYDQYHVLAQDQGKVKLVQQLKLPRETVIIGDGYNDYEVKAAGLVDTFIAFTENISRKEVIDNADAVIEELEGLFITCNLPFEQAKSHKKALLLENVHPNVIENFTRNGFTVEIHPSALSGEALKNKLQEVSILGIRSKTDVTEEVLIACPMLEAIGAFCIGTNQISVETCNKLGIAVFNAPFSNTRSVVELAIAEIILLARNGAALSNKLAKGQWLKSSEGAHEVRGKTLGIIGYGNIGSQLSIIAEALGLHVIFYDIQDKLPLGNAKSCHSLEELLSKADIVSLHVDGRKENHHLIDEKAFSLMKDGVIFLNLSRDFIVDYDALHHALSSGKIFGTGIDVFPNEPSHSKSEYKINLQSFENILLTPHIGGSTEEAQENIGEYVSKNVSAYINEGSSTGSVNFPQLFLPSVNCPQRIIHIHKNVPGILAKINNIFAKNNANIEGQFLKTNQEIGYVITDINHVLTESVLDELSAIEHTIKVRILNKQE